MMRLARIRSVGLYYRGHRSVGQWRPADSSKVALMRSDMSFRPRVGVGEEVGGLGVSAQYVCHQT